MSTDPKSTVAYWRAKLAALGVEATKATSSPMASLRETWRSYLEQREARRDARCRKYGTKRSDKFGSCWSGPAKIVESVKAKLLAQHGEKDLFSARAEKVSQLQELAGIRNRVAWNNALDAWASGCQRLDERLGKLPTSQVQVYDHSKK